MSTRDDDIQRNDPSNMGGYSSSNTQRIADDMTVYDFKGDKVGTVSGSTTNADYFKLAKGLLFPRDYYVPMSAVSSINPDGVHLNVLKDEIKDLGWDNPPLGAEQGNESVSDRMRDALDPNDEPRP